MGAVAKKHLLLEAVAFTPFTRLYALCMHVGKELKTCIAAMLALIIIVTQVVSFNDSWTRYSCDYAATVGDGTGSNQARRRTDA